MDTNNSEFAIAYTALMLFGVFMGVLIGMGVGWMLWGEI